MKLLLVLMVLVSGALGAQPYTEVQGEREFSGRMICLPTPGNLSAASAYIPNDTVVPATGQIYFPLGAGQTENQCHDELMAMGIFEYVEPDWVVFLTAVPNDPIYPQQWHHGVLGSEAGWDVHTGDLSVTVAICDTGWEPHQDLSVGWRDNYNATTQLFVSQGGDASAVHYHGNATTGVAAATGNNGLGVTGVGWNLSKRMLRVSEQSTGSASLSVIQHAVRTAAQQGDQCISVSYSGCDNLSNLTTATYARELGSLLFWSGGNDNRGLTLGNRDLDDIIIVGGTDQSDSKASFSAHGEYLDLSGPAVGITTTTIGTGGTYINASGTSFSCPMAAGVAALIFSADPTLTADEVELLLKMGCDDKGVPGIDDTYGHGRLSLQGSLALIGSPAFHTLSIAEVTGTPGVVAQVPVTLQNPEPVHGFSFGVMHDVSVAQFTTLSPGTGLPQPPEYWQGTHYATQGGFTVAAILS
ncbi:MAG: S8 family serine peptidase, partial [Pseudomonadales bacterium]|nr:S8 family serine peptidase [Pseudomonadales bacterium]